MTSAKTPRRFYSGNPRRLNVAKGSLHQCLPHGTWLEDPVKRSEYFCGKACRQFSEWHLG